MSTTTEQADKQKPKVETASLLKRIKTALLLSAFLGLLSTNIATLVSDSLHTTAFDTLKTVLGYALSDIAVSKMLSQSPTIRRKDDVAVKTKDLTDKNTRL